MNKYIGSKYRYLLSFLVAFVSLSLAMKVIFFPDIETLFGPITPGGLGFLIGWCLLRLISPNEEVVLDMDESRILSNNIRGASRTISFAEVDVVKSRTRSYLDKLNFSYTIFGFGKKQRIVISGLTFGIKRARAIHQEILNAAKNA